MLIILPPSFLWHALSRIMYPDKESWCQLSLSRYWRHAAYTLTWCICMLVRFLSINNLYDCHVLLNTLNEIVVIGILLPSMMWTPSHLNTTEALYPSRCYFTSVLDIYMVLVIVPYLVTYYWNKLCDAHANLAYVNETLKSCGHISYQWC